MTPEQHARMAHVLAQAMELAPEQRAQFLAQECRQDEALHREVESLLQMETAAEGFIESPAWAAGGKHCVKCGQRYEREQQTCDVDGELLSLPDPYGLVGKTLAGRYRVEALVGMGGMGAVYSAEHTALKRRVAFKILQPNIAMSNGQMAALFAREAQTIGRITHENVADVKDAGQTPEGIVYLVMEWLEGRTLEDALREKGIFTLAETGAILKQVCAALEAAHQAGIVHRDLKPSNVMLVRRTGGSEQVKVVDFGIAKILGEAVGATVSQVMGTPHYASPEQLQMGARIDGRTDIYSLGVMLYQMLSGRLPFNALSIHELLRLQQTAEPPPLRQVRTDVPEAIAQLVNRMLAKNPNLRPQRAGEVSRLLEAAIKFSLESGPELQAALPPATTSPGNAATIILSPRIEASKITLEQKGEVDTEGGSKLTEPIPRRIQRRKKWILAGLTVLSVVAIGAAYVAYQFWQLMRNNTPPAQLVLSQLTFDPGLQGEPTWSPDGRFVAYSSNRSGNFDIWVQQVGGGNPVQITKNPAHDWQPEFSPDGSRIVFRSERGEGGLYVIPALGGNELMLSSLGFHPSWSPDGSQIFFRNSALRTSEGIKLYLVGLDGKSPQPLFSGFFKEFSIGSAAWYPDGKRISVWGRGEEGYEFWTLPLDGAQPIKSKIDLDMIKRLYQIMGARVQLHDFCWAKSGRFLYVEGVTRGVKNLWRQKVAPDTLEWVGDPQRLTTGAGQDGELSLSSDGKKLAFAIRRENTRIWSVSFDAAKGQVKGEGQPLTSAGIDANMPDLSRDGKKLVYTKSIAGKSEFWEKSLEDGHETLLAADDFVRATQRWSWDGKWLAYRRCGFSLTAFTGGCNLVLMPAGGGKEQILTSTSRGGNTFDWSPDGSRILVTSFGSSKKAELSWIPVSAAPQAETKAQLVAADPEMNLWQGRFSTDGKWITLNGIKQGGQSTIYVAPSSGGKLVQITEGKYWDDKPRWSPDSKTIYFISIRTGFLNVWAIRFDPVNGKPEGEPFQVTRFADPSRMAPSDIFSSELSITDSRLVLPVTEASGNIWVLENVDQ